MQLTLLIYLFLFYPLGIIHGSNWAKYSDQTTKLLRLEGDAYTSSSSRLENSYFSTSVWSGRFGQAAVTYRRTTTGLRSSSTNNNNNNDAVEEMVFHFGGEEFQPICQNNTADYQKAHSSSSCQQTLTGALKNDVWVGKSSLPKRSDGNNNNNNGWSYNKHEKKVKSSFQWFEIVQGYTPPSIVALIPKNSSTSTSNLTMLFLPHLPNGQVEFWDWSVCQPYFFTARDDDDKLRHRNKELECSKPLTGDILAKCPKSVVTGLYGQEKEDCFVTLQATNTAIHRLWNEYDITMWSPRRGHSSVAVDDKGIWVAGGRATQFGGNSRKQWPIGSGTMDHHSGQHYVELMNDVWASYDNASESIESDSNFGKKWELINPGCRPGVLQHDVWKEFGRFNNVNVSPDSDDRRFLPTGNDYQCKKDSDCFGSEVCLESFNVCICGMWMNREDFSFVVHRVHPLSTSRGNTPPPHYMMYIIGGFTTTPTSYCAQSSCGGGYRLALADIWMSSNLGRNWTQLQSAISLRENTGNKDLHPDAVQKNHQWTGRGGHSAVIIQRDAASNSHFNDQLWILGGQSGFTHEDDILFSDQIWVMNLPNISCCFVSALDFVEGWCQLPERGKYGATCLPNPATDLTLLNNTKSRWSGRSGHATVYEPPNNWNGLTRRLYIFGGQNQTSILDDVWVYNWGLEEWMKDWDPRQLYRSRTLDGTVLYTDPSLNEGNHSYKDRPSVWQFYFDELSPIERIVAYSLLPLPTKSQNAPRLGYIAASNVTSLYKSTWDVSRMPSIAKRVPLLSKEHIAILHRLGIYNVKDLSSANLITVLKMRGYSYAHPNTLHPQDGIPYQVICTVKKLANWFFDKEDDGQVNEDGAARPSVTCTKLDPQCTNDNPQLSSWNGCDFLGEHVSQVNVEGLGIVQAPVLAMTKDSTEMAKDLLQDIFWKFSPTRRLYSSSVYVGRQVMLFGGLGTRQASSATFLDSWIRDDTFPSSFLTTKPISYTDASIFGFTCSTPGVFEFQYKIYDLDERLPVTSRWVDVVLGEEINVSWLDNRKGGPGKGWYALYLRAKSPSGNVELFFEADRNIHIWYYIPPPPTIAFILSLLFAFLAVIGGSYLLYRHIKFRKAVERFENRNLQRQARLQNMSGNGDWSEFFREDLDHRNAALWTSDLIEETKEDQKFTRMPSNSSTLNGGTEKPSSVKKPSLASLSAAVRRSDKSRDYRPSELRRRISKVVMHEGKHRSTRRSNVIWPEVSSLITDGHEGV